MARLEWRRRALGSPERWRDTSGPLAPRLDLSWLFCCYRGIHQNTSFRERPSMLSRIATKKNLVGLLAGVVAVFGVVAAFKSLWVYPAAQSAVIPYDSSLLRPFLGGTSFRVLALNPTHHHGGSTSDSPTSADPFRPTFHKCDIVSDTGFVEAPALRRFISELDARYARSRIDWACFTPHHGIQVSEGESTYDLVICFECSKAHLYVDGNGPSVIAFGVPDSPRLEPGPLDRLIQSNLH